MDSLTHRIAINLILFSLDSSFFALLALLFEKYLLGFDLFDLVNNLLLAQLELFFLLALVDHFLQLLQLALLRLFHLAHDLE